MKTLTCNLILAAAFFTGHEVSVSQFGGPKEVLPKIESLGQADHALELFRRGSYSYLLTESHMDMRPYVMAAVLASLPVDFHSRAFEIARAVILEANQHHMDPFFLLAVMKTESNFDLDVVGSHGEIGLMQILPSTAAWLAPQAGLPSKFDLRDPATNIRIGATYFAQLRKTFARQPQRYVGAYNMGARNVRRLLASKTEPHIYPDKVLGNYKDFYRDLSRATFSPSTNVAFESTTH